MYLVQVRKVREQLVTEKKRQIILVIRKMLTLSPLSRNVKRSKDISLMGRKIVKLQLQSREHQEELDGHELLTNQTYPSACGAS